METVARLKGKIKRRKGKIGNKQEFYKLTKHAFLVRINFLLNNLQVAVCADW